MYKMIEIYNESKQPLDINKSGVLNQQTLQFAKTTVLFDAVRKHANELVKHIQGYPKDDKSEVELECDFVILSRSEYDRLTSNQLEQNKSVELKIKV